MYRYRNLDIFVAGGLALLGGAAYVAHAPGPVQVVLGIVLFFTPGYLWSEAILNHTLPGLERVLTSVGLTLILPVIGGFLFFVLRIPLFKSAWVGLLVVLTLLGLVAVAVQRLREQPEHQRQQPDPRRAGQRARAGLSPVNASVYGLAALVALGAVGFSVKNADAQKFPGYSAIYMTPKLKLNAAQIILANPKAHPELPGQGATQAHLGVLNYEGKTETYEIKLLKKGKLTQKWTFTVADGKSWQVTIPYTAAMDTPTLVADLYILPDTTHVYSSADNGEHASQYKPAAKPKSSTKTKSASKTK